MAEATFAEREPHIRGALQAVGLNEAESRPDVGLETVPQQTYVPLPLIQSYVLESDDPIQLTEARDVLESDYHVIPDVPFGLPEPVGRLERFADGANGGTTYPEATGVQAAHAEGNRGAGAVVAVLDSGCDADHVEFSDRIIEHRWVPLAAGAKPRDVRGFDTVNHGTHVSGIIGGKSVGIAPEATLLVASVIESETVPTSLLRIMKGLEWIIQRISAPENAAKPVILNMSLGFRREWLEPTQIANVLIGVRLLLQHLIEDFDVLPVVAIGNDGPDTVRAPGYFPEVLSVGAVDSNLEPAPFSGGGPGPPPFEMLTTPAVVGVGVDVYSSLERDVGANSFYGRLSGTSMATPYVSAIAALVSAKTGLQGDQLRQHLEQTAHQLPFAADRVGKGLAVYA